MPTIWIRILAGQVILSITSLRRTDSEVGEDTAVLISAFLKALGSAAELDITVY